jgi:hypothetical protein
MYKLHQIVSDTKYYKWCSGFPSDLMWVIVCSSAIFDVRWLCYFT